MASPLAPPANRCSGKNPGDQKVSVGSKSGAGGTEVNSTATRLQLQPGVDGPSRTGESGYAGCRCENENNSEGVVSVYGERMQLLQS